MKKLLVTACLLFGSSSAFAETYEELMDLLTIDNAPRVETGIVRDIDFATRKVIISGYEYAVAPAGSPTPLDVDLKGTTAGSFELLKVDMPVEITYYEFNVGRVLLHVIEIDDNLELEF